MPIVSEAHLQARRDQILEAAQRCFARDGFHATTMQDICREAELSAGAVYRYFEGKREIVEAVFERSLADTRKMADLLLQFDDPREGLDQLLETAFGLMDQPAMADDMRFGAVIIGEAARDEHFAAQYARLYRALAESFGGAVESAKAAGLVSPALDPEYAVRLLAAVWEGYRVQKLVDPEVRADRFVATLRLMLYGPAPDPEE